MNSCSYCKLSDDPVLFETAFWNVVLSEDQAYLGRSIIYLKRHTSMLSELTPQEWIDLGVVAKRLEQALTKEFGAIMFNWTCMMNDAYKEGTTAHVHWHCRARYSSKKVFESVEFSDPEFGNITTVHAGSTST